MKAKQSSGLNHTTTGRRGSLALHDYLRAVCSGTDWQAGGGEQPVSGESFVVSRPLGRAVAAPGAGDRECSGKEPLPVPGAGRWGRKGLTSGSGFPVLQKKQRPGRNLQAREKPRLEGGSRQKVEQVPGQPPPCQPLPDQENTHRAPGSQSLRRLPDFSPWVGTSSPSLSPSLSLCFV